MLMLMVAAAAAAVEQPSDGEFPSRHAGCRLTCHSLICINVTENLFSLYVSYDH